MKRNEFELILNELKALRDDMMHVRTKDIPTLNTAVTGFRAEIETLKKNQTWSTRLYTIIGGAITVAIVKFTGHQ